MTRWEQALWCIRNGGPMTAAALAARVGFDVRQAQAAINRGRRNGFLVRTGKSQDQHFIYGAVQVPGWPEPAPDTIERKAPCASPQQLPAIS